MLTETLRKDSLSIESVPGEPEPAGQWGAAVALAESATDIEQLPSQPPAAEQSARPAVSPVRRRSWVLPILFLLTLIGGGLRFVALDHPSVWGDEAATYGRVAGSYQDLLDQLWDSSFPPLHYETLWWISQGMPYWGHVVPRAGQPANGNEAVNTFVPTKFLVPGGIRLTPFYLRLIPAIAGTLFIPAIYFLSRQLFGPRVSLTAAFLACFSAYLLVYSRDAKMYMPFWTLCVLNLGTMLWWLRVRRINPWLLWVATGAAMIGWHASGLMLLAIEGVVFLTSPRLHWRKLLTLTGFALWPLATLPLYGLERLRRRYDLIDWLRWKSFIGWPLRAWRAFKMPAVLPFAVGLLVMLSTMFGPLGFYSAFDSVYQRVSGDDRAAVDTGSLGIDWVPRYNMGRDLSGYLLYTGSAYLTGWEWPRHLPAVGLDDQALVYPRTLRLLQIGTVGILALLAIGLVPWRRAFSRSWARLERMRNARFVAPTTRRRRVLWMAIWLTAIPWIVYTQSTLRPTNIFDGFASLVLKNPPAPRWPRAMNTPGQSVSLTAQVQQWWNSLAKPWPAEWKTYAAAFRADNLDYFGISIASGVLLALAVLTILKWRRLAGGALRLIGVLGILAIVGSVIGFLPKFIDNDVWMPRYVGVVFPAVLIFAAVLISRQPSRWITYATLGLFVIVNMGQFAARVWGNSEPPMALMASDLIAAQPKSILPQNPAEQTFRDYTNLGTRPVAEPGGSSLFNPSGRYYLHLFSGFTDRSRLVRQGQFEDELNTWKNTSPEAIERDLKQSPQIKRFAVWTIVPPFELDQSDPIGDRLAGAFKRVSDETWPVADHWRWVQHPQFRRRLYEKLPDPQWSTPPSPAPSPNPTRQKPPAKPAKP